MTMHVMWDIETLDSAPSAVILTFGAVKFDPYSNEDPHDPVYFKLDVDTQTEMGRTISESTLEWWGQQPVEIFEEAMSEHDRVSLEHFTTSLNRYLVGAEKIWAQGPTFDMVILSDLYKSLKKPTPWEYWKVRDSRTIFDLGDDSLKTNNKVLHNALADAYSQAIAVQAVYRQLGIKKK